MSINIETHSSQRSLSVCICFASSVVVADFGSVFSRVSLSAVDRDELLIVREVRQIYRG